MSETQYPLRPPAREAFSPALAHADWIPQPGCQVQWHPPGALPAANLRGVNQRVEGDKMSTERAKSVQTVLSSRANGMHGTRCGPEVLSLSRKGFDESGQDQK